MSRIKYWQYYVEGECEEKFINVLKTELKVLRAGKVQVLNVIKTKITKPQLMILKPNTAVILVYDTDVANHSILEENLKILDGCQQVSTIIHIPQVYNFEDELKRSIGLNDVIQFTGSKSHNDFKRDFLHMNNIAQKLKEFDFDTTKLWGKNPSDVFKGIISESSKIKI